MSVRLSNASTTGSPMVKFGTKWLSITSTCSQSAPVTAAASSPSSAKSAARIDGAIRGTAMRSPYFEGGREHRIGAVPVWPELHVRTITEVVDGLEQRPGVQCGHWMAAQRVSDNADRLCEMRRTRRVQHHATRAGQPDRRGEQFTLQLGQRRNIAGLPPPSGFGPAAQRAKARARGIHQHPVEARVDPGVAAVYPQHLDGQATGVLLD